MATMILLLDAALRAAYGATGAKASSTAAAESAAGLLGRAFASPPRRNRPTLVTRALTPDVLMMAGRRIDQARRNCILDPPHLHGLEFGPG